MYWQLVKKKGHRNCYIKLSSKFSPEARDEELVLSSKKLAIYLDLAEGLEEIEKTGQTVKVALRPGIRKRRRGMENLECGGMRADSRGRSLEKGQDED